MKIVIEVQHGNRTSLHKFDLRQQLVVIGRGWDADLIVQDEHVDAEHLRLTLNDNGQLVIADMQTLNGSELGRKALDGERVYSAGERIRIGETVLRLYSANEPVKATKPISVWQDLQGLLARRWVVASLVLAALFVAVLEAFFNATRPFKSMELLQTVLTVSGGLLVWALLMGLVSKLLRHRMAMLPHGALAALMIVATGLTGLVMAVYRFNVQSAAHTDFIETIIGSLMLAVFIYASLTFATLLGSRLKTVLAIMVGLIPLVVVWGMPLLQEEHQGWTASSSSESQSLPPALLLRTPVSVDSYMLSSDDLFETLNEIVDTSGQ